MYFIVCFQFVFGFGVVVVYLNLFVVYQFVYQVVWGFFQLVEQEVVQVLVGVVGGNGDYVYGRFVVSGFGWVLGGYQVVYFVIFGG